MQFVTACLVFCHSKPFQPEGFCCASGTCELDLRTGLSQWRGSVSHGGWSSGSRLFHPLFFPHGRLFLVPLSGADHGWILSERQRSGAYGIHHPGGELQRLSPTPQVVQPPLCVVTERYGQPPRYSSLCFLNLFGLL